MNPKQRVKCVLLGLLLGSAPAGAQVPDEFTNLKLLPEDIGKRELMDVMRAFSGALGVQCTHCHMKSADDPESVDFASDDLEPKRVARAMMKMADEINGKLLPTTGRDSPTRVRCVTCHRGLTDPEPLDRVLAALIDEKGVDAAVERYGELRGEYYGTGAYDFGADTLNTVAEEVAQEKHDVDGAIRLTRLNLEQHPDAARAHVLLGQLLAEKGDTAGAIASLERALELEPGNRWAGRMLDRIRPRE